MRSSPNSPRDSEAQGEYADSAKLDLRKRKPILEKIFLFNFQIYKVEESLCTNLFTKAFLTAYFLITGVSITEWGLLNNKHLQEIRNPFDTATRLLVVAFYAALITMLVVGVFRPLKVNSQPTLFDYLVVWGKFLHIYVVLPVCFWLFSGELFDWGSTTSGVSASQLTFTWVILPVGLLLAGFFTTMRNLLPSGSKLSTPNKYSEFAVYLFFLLLIAIGNNVSGTSAESAWDLTSIIASGLCAVFYSSVQTFWYYSVNTWFICGHLTIFAVRLSFVLLRAYHSTPNLLEILVFSAVPFVLGLKGTINGCELLLKNRIMMISKIPLLQGFGVFVEYDLVQQVHAANPNHTEMSPSL